MSQSPDDPIVLFVDDEPLIRKYFARMFGRELNVKTAASCTQARQALSNYGGRVAVLITDQRMPGGDGVLLLSEAKAEYPHIVRLLTTAYTDIDHAIAAVNQGEIWRFITKPWDIEGLRTVLATAMDVYRAQAHEQELLNERRRGMLMLAGHMAHEMRTPLQTVQLAALGIEQALPRLLEGYDWAISQGADVKPVTKRHRRVLEESTAGVRRVVNRTNAVIDLLLANAGAYRIDPALFERCAISDCVDVALEDFPFADNERDVVSWDGGPEFHFNGAVNLMVLVLHNLLRNALRAVAAASRGEIYIWTAIYKDRNALHVKDTGTGIPPERLPRIFDDFASFSDDQRSAGIGLGFCRKVMTSFGGNIHCHSEKDRYTQFDLWLPVAEQQTSVDQSG